MSPTSSNIVDAFLFLNYRLLNNVCAAWLRIAGEEVCMDMLIDGGWTRASDGNVDPVLNPATDDQIDTVPRATVADVERAVAAAQRGKAAMAAMPAWRRYEILEAVARRIEANQAALGKLLCRENGKRIGETTSEVGVAARIFRGYAEEAKRIFGRSVPLHSIPGREKSLAITTREPLGVIAAIVPFNYPVELWSHKVAGGLAAGNAVITKTPEDCPLAVIEVSRYLEEAGLPRGAHQLLTGGRDVGEALVRAEGVQMIAMTGSTAAGKRILEVAAATLKKVHLELGGNDATIVCGDADVEATADALIAGRFTSGNGQICCAVKRVLVEQPIYQKLLDAVAARAKTLRVGDPMDPDDRCRTADQPARRRARRGAGAPGRRRRRDNRHRRQAPRQFLRADDPDRRHAGHAGLRRRDLRAGAAADPLRSLRRGAGAGQ